MPDVAECTRHCRSMPGGAQLSARMRCSMEQFFYARLDSPVGPLLVGMSRRGLAVLAFGHELPARLAGAPMEWREGPEACAEVTGQLDEYFAGRRRQFDLPLDLRGTDFQTQCWDELLRIPYGEIAAAIGNPKAVRAVGGACGANPIPVLVPCHRVLAGGKELGGYGGGLPTKAFLLRLEGAAFVDPAAEQDRQLVLH